eukprot:CAMPEP_0115732082 /NCGR_PEP_ID=MMETSP0272-20121206/84933_1 /TAXON_ID=71861 /ORGANISM="Scrippsiella trochoidea, Strain CCMP3099" /LENGTH=45 /DNA_ID= /DNA_START= /DNA_END= /DNA_ORIENTATION=
MDVNVRSRLAAGWRHHVCSYVASTRQNGRGHLATLTIFLSTTSNV